VRAFKRQAGRFPPEDQHKRPVCPHFNGGARHPAARGKIEHNIRDGFAKVTDAGEFTNNRIINIMKTKIILTVVAVLAAAVLCGCGQRNAEENTMSANPAQNQPSSSATATNAPVAPPATPATPPVPPMVPPAMTNSATTNK